MKRHRQEQSSRLADTVGSTPGMKSDVDSTRNQRIPKALASLGLTREGRSLCRCNKTRIRQEEHLWTRRRRRRSKRKTMATVLLSTIMIILVISTTTNLLLPQVFVHSLSLNKPATQRTQIFSTTSLPLADPSTNPTRSGRPRRYNNNNKYNPNPNSAPSGESRWQRAVRIEKRTQVALEGLQQRINQNNTSNRQEGGDQQLSPSGKNTIIIRRGKSGVLSSVPSSPSSSPSTPNSPPVIQWQLVFPDIRECNSALAAFGDGGDLLRALRLYFKMRKATQIALRVLSAHDGGATETPLVPTPTLVTYSTLMSRAVSLGKPQVALRLWKIMRGQTDFFSYASYSNSLSVGSSNSSKNGGNNDSSPTPSGVSIKASELKNLIVPDVKSANILMNTYAKLGDIVAAEDLMKQMQTKPQQQSSSPHNVIFGGGIDVPYLKPNLVTYNTLLDACQKTGEIDKALYWKSVLEKESQTSSEGRNRVPITYKNGRIRSIRLRPDARTYTSLIGTVANKRASSSYSYGTHDPSLAFQLLEEMKDKHRIAPNPLTYSALIDVCGRCKRSDLALKALRLMLRDEQMLQRIHSQNNHKHNSNNNSSATTAYGAISDASQQTVGAWTAAINACGKTGRIDTALKLFFVSMPRFKVKPNVITCSCLLDSLLKQGKTADSLEVLRYMKAQNLSPSEYMYTSLMNYAGRLAGREQNKHQRRYNDVSTNRPWPSIENPNDSERSIEGRSKEDQTKAVDLYSELMSTLIATTERKPQKPPIRRGAAVASPSTKAAASTTSNELYQVTMVFREMKASGVVPDLGSYNMLLRSCANSGDIDRAQEILKDILDPSNDLEPNDRTWRAVLRAAGKAKRSDMVLQTWKSAVADMGGNDENQKLDLRQKSSSQSSSSSKKQRKSNNLSLQTFRTLIMALLICAWDLRDSDRHTSAELYKVIIKCYNALRTSPKVSGEEEGSASKGGLYMGMHLVDSKAVLYNPQVLASVLQAVVNLESLLERDDDWRPKLKKLGASIAGAECLVSTSSLSYFDKKALQTARSWY